MSLLDELKTLPIDSQTKYHQHNEHVGRIDRLYKILCTLAKVTINSLNSATSVAPDYLGALTTNQRFLSKEKMP